MAPAARVEGPKGHRESWEPVCAPVRGIYADYGLVWGRAGYPPYPSRTWDEVVDSLHHFRMIWGCRPYPYPRRAPRVDIACVLGAIALAVLILFAIL